MAAQSGAEATRAAAPADEPVLILEPESPEDRIDLIDFRRPTAVRSPAPAPADEILFIE